MLENIWLGFLLNFNYFLDDYLLPPIPLLLTFPASLIEYFLALITNNLFIVTINGCFSIFILLDLLAILGAVGNSLLYETPLAFVTVSLLSTYSSLSPY